MRAGFVEREACPLCRSPQKNSLCDLGYDEAELAAFIERFYGNRVAPAQLLAGRFRVVACAHCGLIYQDPILDDDAMRLLYQRWVDQDASLRKKQDAGAGLFRQYAGQMQTLLKIFDGPPRQTRVLDFGMGWGYWSRMAQAHGLAVTGFELSEERRRHAQSMGIDVITELPPRGEHFDIIYANQVFEHLPEPLATLRQLRDLLTPRGLIYIRVPDGRGVAHTLKRHGWSPGLDAVHPLEHINCFTRASLIRLAAEAGLKPVGAPLRLSWGSLLGGMVREFADRFLTTHLYLRPRP